MDVEFTVTVSVTAGEASTEEILQGLQGLPVPLPGFFDTGATAIITAAEPAPDNN
jgi:hypothetical protein